MAWQHGQPGTGQVVVVVANFSDFTIPPGPNAEYIVHNWPATPAGKTWREVSQDRDVPPAWVGREPVFNWEAKIYTLA